MLLGLNYAANFSQVSLPDPYHPMFELHLTRKREKCETFLNWLDTAVDVYQKYRRYVLDNRPGEGINLSPLTYPLV